MNAVNAPKPVEKALQMLYNANMEAYAVGGCVRDSLLGKTPNDWDITTSATPKEVEQVFEGYRVLETGIKHGTVTVLLDGTPLEITTFRVDGQYLDARHPESVSFSRNLLDDVTRRDFTVNTLCWNPQTGVVDLCGGIADLQKGILRAVGEPDRRFQEDALRILRGLRFSATLGFKIEAETAKSILRNRQLLTAVSAERIQEEFTKLLLGKNAAKVLREFHEVIEVFIPELTPLLGCPQHTPYHCYDVFEHTLHALESIENDEILRLCMFFHDFAKPACRRTDKAGTDHFKGHEKAGAELVRPILLRLRYPRKTVDTVTELIAIHDTKAPKSKMEAKQLLRKIGVDNYRALIKIKRADNLAKADPHAIDKKLLQMKKYLSEILENGECYSLKALTVNGNDLKSVGISDGPEMHRVLDALLDAVIADTCPNEKDALLCFAKTLPR